MYFCQIVSARATMMRWIGRMDAQRALVEGGKDDAGTGELVFILIKILILIIKIFILINILMVILILSLLKAADGQSISSTDLVVVTLSVDNK